MEKSLAWSVICAHGLLFVGFESANQRLLRAGATQYGVVVSRIRFAVGGQSTGNVFDTMAAIHNLAMLSVGEPPTSTR